MAKDLFDAIVFDFDGVLVESVDVKTKAFAELYKPYGDEVVSQVMAYHLAHGGVSRFEKFRYFHTQLLNQPLSKSEEERLGDTFSALVEDAVVASPWVAGAKEFLDAYGCQVPLFVASGTPEGELVRIVNRRKITQCFRGVYGAPTKKGEILLAILAGGKYRAERLLMIGDAMTDYEGALLANASFLGRVPKGWVNPFPSNIPVLEDLTGLPEFLWN